MRIISVDPGYDRIGIAIIDKNKAEKEKLVYSECFETNRKEDPHQRIFSVGDKVGQLIKEYSPERMAIENLFLTNNQKTAMRVSESRGVIIYESMKKNIPVFEFSPSEIKSSICGNGRADKKSVTKMIPLLIKIDKKIKRDDEYDAIAIGLTFFAINR